MKAAVLILAATSAQAGGVFQVPTGCDGAMTVQTRDCSVSHFYRCAANPGDLHRVDLSETGITYMGRTDAEARWLESVDAEPGSRRVLGTERDPMRLSELMENGIDSYDIDMVLEDGRVRRVMGYDALTGASARIDGVDLLVTEFQMTIETQGTPGTWVFKGNEYVMPDMGVFLGGIDRVETPDGTFDTDSTPMEFAFPGDDGFMAMRPVHGCGLQTAALAVEGSNG